ncbi:DUF6923 family protein [Spirosoma endophyticum]|uniref:Por secretion system C-terminal sorting domain-containing protein n=1 Tax=Spirosoma endophyticum TaxID=662367 RepID=A0A1I1FXS9_9BACT|nr:T9SS type A sorting domain-containing protein [Spirosoma endophyticum]SFC01853.1 Por secretion system C-terminal sorting domain-containing protein [Spirosoma endophyticum]
MKKIFTLLNLTIFWCLLALLVTHPLHGQPPTFSCASASSYLFAGNTDANGTSLDSDTRVFQVNVLTGVSTLAGGPLLTSGNTSVNAIGYNVKDNYIWGYRRGTNQLVRIASDFTVTTYSITGLPNDVPFNAGDIDANGVLYLYRGAFSNPGAGATLKRIDLNPASANYLKLLSDITLSPVDANRLIIDYAFNPVDGQLYGIDAVDNHLNRINPSTGLVTDLGYTGITDTGKGFGAVFVDNAGTIYASLNTTGRLYKIPNVSTGNATATFLNNGPITNDNDGARCPNAAIPIVTLSGSVLNDANGLTDNTVNGTPVSTLSGNTLYANLVSNGQVLATTPLTNGTYSFTGVSVNSSYTVVVSNSVSAIGSAPPSTTLTGGVVHTGGNIGTGAGSDGTPDGRLAVTVATSNISNINFGINRIPVVVAAVDTPRPNPVGTATVPISSTVFSGTDPEDGSYPTNLTGRTVTLTPATNGTLYYNSTAVSSTQVITNFDPTKLSLDPTATGATTGTSGASPDPTFTYAVSDNAGVVSVPAVVRVPFTAYTLSGNVLNDGNGLTDGLVNTSGTGALTPVNGTSLDGAQLYATLVSSNGTALATVPVTATGTYSFSDVGNGIYSVVLSTNSSGSTTASLPASYTNTGEHLGTGTGSDGIINGILTNLTIAGASVNNANFGIDKKPVVVAAVDTPRPNPGGSTPTPISSTVFSGSDLEDGTYPANLTGRTVTLTPATNGTLYYNSTAVSSTQVITNFDPTKLSLNPTATGATTGTSGASPDPTFTYAVNDNAGVTSVPAVVRVPFTAFSRTISGNVLNDSNGLVDNTVNGSGVNGPALPVYVSLVQNGTIMATVPVTVTGTYSFTGATSNTSYTVVLTTNPAGSSTPGVPTGYVNTGETIGTGVGSDGTPNGVQVVAVGTSSVSDVNFGIEQLPTTGGGVNTVVNAGGATPVTVPANTFTNTTLSRDVVPGTVTSIRITAFPSNTTSLTINGTVYSATSAEFSGGSPAGVIVATDGNGNPTVPILVNPTIDTNPVSIPFKAIDNAGKESTNTGTAVLNFTSPMPVNLVSFQGKWIENTGNTLNWTTSWEKNNDHFDVQSSTNAKSFETIGRVAGKGTIEALQTYTFVDTHPQSELTYYRLKQVDLGGAFNYSQIIGIRRDDPGQMLVVYPNPTSDKLKLTLTNQIVSETTLYSLAGQLVLHQLGNTSLVDVQSLPTGLYVIEVKTVSGALYRQRFMKQ